MDPHEKWTHKVDSVVHWRPRFDAAQTPMFYSTVCFSRESKGQSQAGFYSSYDLNSFFIMPPPFCLAFCFPPAFFPSRAIPKFNQVSKVIECRVPILSSPISSFLRRGSISAAINKSVIRQIRIRIRISVKDGESVRKIHLGVRPRLRWGRRPARQPHGEAVRREKTEGPMRQIYPGFHRRRPVFGWHLLQLRTGKPRGDPGIRR